jgi:PPM family protein phosphatase
VHVVAKTDVGLVRKRNEDYFVLVPEHDLVVLCDGMGGHPGGDLASRMAAEEVKRAVVEKGSVELPPGNLHEIQVLKPFANLILGVFSADQELRAYGRRHAEFQGMGTTLAALQEHRGNVCAVHVGDSRVYVFRGGKLLQLTEDHSYIATLPEAARASFAGIRNILTRAVGVGEELEIDFTIVPAQSDELYLLCTDGLHNYVSEERIAEVLGTTSDREVCLQTLVEDAKSGGGGDNVTLALAWVDAPPAKPGPRLSGAVIGTPTGLRAHVQT